MRCKLEVVIPVGFKRVRRGLARLGDIAIAVKDSQDPFDTASWTSVAKDEVGIAVEDFYMAARPVKAKEARGPYGSFD